MTSLRAPLHLLGTLALLATLLLSGPGVRTVRAEGPEAAAPLRSELEAGPTCSADAQPDFSAIQVLSQQLQRPEPKPIGPYGDVLVGHTPDGQEIIVLNNQGMGYGQGPAAGLQAIQQELQRVYRERRE